MVSLLGVEWMQYRATGRQPPRRANRDPNACPHGVFRCAGDDDWCALAVTSDGEFAALCELMERPELASDGRFTTHGARKAHEDALDALVSAWTRDQERWQLATRLQAAGIAAAPVEHLRDTYERDPQLRHHYQHVRQPGEPAADIPIDREAIRFAGVEHRLERAPVLGEHSESVLREIVGLSDEAYTRLVLDGVIT